MRALSLSLALVGSAAAHAPPRIELDLHGIHTERLEEANAPPQGNYDPSGSQYPQISVHAGEHGYHIPSVIAPINSDWVSYCPAGPTTNAQNCMMPTAMAYDHQDQTLDVTTTIWRIDGTTSIIESAIDYEDVGAYLIKFNAVDHAGIHAEEIVFGLILNDIKKPLIESPCSDVQHVESCSDWTLCAASATDLHCHSTDPSSDISSSIRYLITRQPSAGFTAHHHAADNDHEDDHDHHDNDHQDDHDHQTTDHEDDHEDDHHDNDHQDDHDHQNDHNHYHRRLSESVHWSQTTDHSYEVNEHGEAVICEECTLEEARHRFTSSVPGTYNVLISAHDNAGMFGYDGKNNVQYKMQTVVIEDHTSPVISVHGLIPVMHQCAVPYVDLGATCSDSCDGKLTATATGTVDIAEVGKYTLNYNCIDFSDNAANEKHRDVYVHDTKPPTITLVGRDIVKHPLGGDFSEPGVSTTDDCDKSYLNIAMEWVGPTFDQHVMGSYTRKYTVRDASGNTATATRVFVVTNQAEPIINLVGQSVVTVEACSEADNTPYVDEGAACHDVVDGDIPMGTHTIGGVTSSFTLSYGAQGIPQCRIQGTYTVVYRCTDSSGHHASATREVVVKDTACPTLTLTGPNVVHMEASFKYVDQGATASDAFDGNITSKITTDGDTVNTALAYINRRSCKEIKSVYPMAKSGRYFISTIDHAGKLQKIPVFCDMTTFNGLGGTNTGLTYYACNGCTRVQPYRENQGGCAMLGLQMPETVTDLARFYFVQKEKELPMESRYFPGLDSTSDYYLCTTDAVNTRLGSTKALAAHDEISEAEHGKYIINYHVKDAANNEQCAPVSRTVIVQDTLAPVISLRYAGTVTKIGHDSSALGINGVANPAGVAVPDGSNPQLSAP